MPKNFNELLYALGCCDIDFMNKSPLQRFDELVRHRTESLEAFLNRCEIYFHATQLDNSKRTWYIKDKFLEGGNISEKIKGKLRPYSNLDELLIACKNLISRQKCNKKLYGSSKSKMNSKRNSPLAKVAKKLAMPLMDIKFPSKTIFMKNVNGLNFDQVITKCKNNSHVWD